MSTLVSDWGTADLCEGDVWVMMVLLLYKVLRSGIEPCAQAAVVVARDVDGVFLFRVTFLATLLVVLLGCALHYIFCCFSP